MSVIITEEDLNKAKKDLAKEIRTLRNKYRFLHRHEIKTIVLEEFGETIEDENDNNI